MQIQWLLVWSFLIQIDCAQEPDGSPETHTSDLQMDMVRLPPDVQEILKRKAASDSVSLITSASGMYDLVSTIPSSLEMLLESRDPIKYSLVPGVILHCLKNNNRHLLIRILSYPFLLQSNNKPTADPLKPVLTSTDMYKIANEALDPNGAYFKPGSYETQKILVKWIHIQQWIWNDGCNPIRMWAAYHGDLDNYRLISSSIPPEYDTSQFLAIISAISNGQIDFLKSSINLGLLRYSSSTAMGGRRLGMVHLLNIALLRHELDIFRFLFERNALLNPSLDNLPEIERALLYFIASEIGHFPMQTLIKELFFANVKDWSPTETLTNGRKIFVAQDLDSVSKLNPVQLGVIKFGNLETVKEMLHKQLLGPITDCFKAAILHRKDEEVFAMYILENPSYQSLFDFTSKWEADSFFQEAFKAGSISVIQNLILKIQSRDASWNHDSLLIYFQQNEVSYRTIDWVFRNYQFSPPALMRAILDARFTALAPSLQQLDKHPIPKDVYHKLINLHVKSKDGTALRLILLGPLKKNRLDAVMIKTFLIEEGLYLRSRILMQNTRSLLSISPSILLLLKKVQIDLSAEEFTVLIKDCSGIPVFLDILRRVLVAESPLRSVSSSSPAIMHDLAPQILSILHNVRI